MTAEEKTMRGRKPKLPAAVRRGSALMLTVGFVGTSVLVAPGAMAEVPHTAASEIGENGENAWHPTPGQEVLASNALGQLLGPNIDGEINAADIAGAGVLPGQAVLYEVVADLEDSTDVRALTGSNGVVGQTQVAGETTEGITGFALETQLPAGVTADLDSLQIHDSRLAGSNRGSVISSQNYTATQEGSTVRIQFSDSWVESRLTMDVSGTNELRATFDAQVGDDVEPFTQMTSETEQIVQTPHAVFAEADENGDRAFLNYDLRQDPNEFRVEAESTSFVIPGAEPESEVYEVEDKDEDDVISPIADEVGERVAVGGDRIQFRTLLDGTLAESIETSDWEGNPSGQFLPQPLDLAYSLDRFGYVEDFDADALRINPEDVQVVAFGYNVVGQDGSRNVGDVSRDMDSLTDVTEEFDISVNRTNGTLSVLAKNPDEVAHDGRDYEVRYDATVRNVTEDTTLEAEGTQVVDGTEYGVEQAATVAVQAISPEKAVVELVVDDEDEEIVELDEVPTNGEFTYQFKSSAVPADALYGVEAWSLTDDYTTGDRALHDRWSVRAETAIAGEDGEAIFEPGDIIADPENTDYFETRPSGDSLRVVATSDFLELIELGDNAENDQAWAVYVDAVRTASEGDRVSNTAYEVRNGFERSAQLTSLTGAERLERVSPEAPTREEGSNVITLPEVTGVEYQLSAETADDEIRIPIEGLEVVAVPAEGYTFGADEDLVTTWSFDYAATEISSIEAPSRDGDANVVTVPEVEGVEFSRNGDVTIGEDGLTITAEAAPGFIFAEGVTTEWTFDFTPAVVDEDEDDVEDDEDEDQEQDDENTDEDDENSEDDEDENTEDDDEVIDEDEDENTDEDDENTDEDTDEIRADSFVELSQSSVRAGEAVQVIADGFDRGEQVEISINPVLATEQADNNGEVVLDVVIPVDTEAGDHQISVEGLDSGVTGSADIRVLEAANDDEPIVEDDEDEVIDEVDNDTPVSNEDDDDDANTGGNGGNAGSGSGNTGGNSSGGGNSNGGNSNGGGAESGSGTPADEDEAATDRQGPGPELSGWNRDPNARDFSLTGLDREDDEVLEDDEALLIWNTGEEPEVGDTLADRGTLAQTGASAPLIAVGGGLLLLAAGGAMFLINRRKMAGQ